jgi:uncharacterized membrane protein
LQPCRKQAAGQRPGRGDQRVARVALADQAHGHTHSDRQQQPPDRVPWLAEVRLSFNAFVVTFILTGMYWVGHRDLFALIRRTDRGLVWLNIVYLLPLCLLPFSAGLLGHYSQEPTALHIYGLVVVAIAVMRVVIWLYATSRPHLLWQRLDDRQRRAGLALAAFPGLVYLLAILVAAAAPSLSLAIYAGAPVVYFLSITVLRSSRNRDQEYADFT